MDNDIIYRMFLCGVPGLFYADQMRLLDAFGSFKAIYDADEFLLRMNVNGKQELADAILRLRTERDPEREYENMFNKGIRFTSIADPEYPERLLNIPDPPMGLFHIGELPRDDCPSIAVIGSRACSNYGKEMSLRFAKDLAAAGFDIVSGMAVGIDGYSHRGAMNAGGQTYAVLGSGPDVCYPEANRDVYERMKNCGGILSEYYPGTPPLHLNFPRRNRIIAGLSDAILVVEAKQKSGTLITVDQGLEQGRSIYAVPGKITDTMSAGCNALILSGAGIAVSASNIIEDLAPRYGIKLTTKGRHNAAPAMRENRQFDRLQFERQRKEKTQDSPATEPAAQKKMNSNSRVYETLGVDPLTPEQISEKTGINIREVLGILTLMELDGRCTRVGMSSYVR